MITCKICGKIEDENDFNERVKNDLLKNDMCYECNHWANHYKNDFNGQQDYVIVNGQHFIIGPENVKGFRGFGGHKFIIEFNDGRVVETTNLWHQGDIPDGYWRERMPDNAKFRENVF